MSHTFILVSYKIIFLQPGFDNTIQVFCIFGSMSVPAFSPSSVRLCGGHTLRNSAHCLTTSWQLWLDLSFTLEIVCLVVWPVSFLLAQTFREITYVYVFFLDDKIILEGLFSYGLYCKNTVCVLFISISLTQISLLEALEVAPRWVTSRRHGDS